MPDQTRIPTPPQPSTHHAKSQELDKTPGTLGANASNSGITIDKPGTVETATTQVVDRTSHIETPSVTLGASSPTSPTASSHTSGPSVVEKAARTVLEEGKAVASHAVTSAGALLHEAGDRAAASYAHLARSAEDAVQRGAAGVERTYNQTLRAGSSLGRFASAHALPLMVIGAGLGMLGMSMRRQRAYARTDLYGAPRDHAGRPIEPRHLDAQARRPRYVEGSEGSKLLGPRVRETGTLDGV